VTTGQLAEARVGFGYSGDACGVHFKGKIKLWQHAPVAARRMNFTHAKRLSPHCLFARTKDEPYNVFREIGHRKY
jgi:hypothetical protein